MSSFDPTPPAGDDMLVRRTLVARYAPPADSAYWDQLEARIMARVATESVQQWWAWFPGWVRYGLVAAAAAVLVAALASWQTRVAQDRLAVRELLDTPSEIPLLSEVVTPPDRDRNQTLRYLLTH
jgi:anti-sigma-K factor RskA